MHEARVQHVDAIGGRFRETALQLRPLTLRQAKAQGFKNVKPVRLMVRVRLSLSCELRPAGRQPLLFQGRNRVVRARDGPTVADLRFAQMLAAADPIQASRFRPDGQVALRQWVSWTANGSEGLLI